MSVLPVLLHPHPVLRQKAKAVKDVTLEIRQLLDDMLDTMYDASGIGLAAPQIGRDLRVVVIDVERDRDNNAHNPICMINPEIILKSDDLTELEEGCLSLPEMLVPVKRPDRVTVRYMDENGVEQTIEADDLLAKCVQHEIDHLNGVLIFDYLSPLKRDIALRRYQKMLRDAGV